MPQQINLYDPALRLQRDLLTAHVLLAAVCVSTLAIVISTVFAKHKVQELQAQARQTDSALREQQVTVQRLAGQPDALRPDARLVAEVGLAQATLERRRAALAMLRAGRFGRQEGYAAALEGIARQSVSNLWLTGLVLDGADLALRGRALSPELIPAYIGRLNQEPALQGRSFRALDIQRPAGETVAPAASGAGSAPAPAGTASPPAMPLARYVEFSLTGSGGAMVGDKESKP